MLRKVQSGLPGWNRHIIQYTIFLNFFGNGGAAAAVTGLPLAGGAADARPADDPTVVYIIC